MRALVQDGREGPVEISRAVDGSEYRRQHASLGAAAEGIPGQACSEEGDAIDTRRQLLQ